MVAAYLAIVFSVAVSIIVNQRTLNRMDKNIELSRKTVDTILKGELISNYPLLSQKIDTEGVSSNILIAGGPTHYETHFLLKIKNFGKGPAINQDHVVYRFFQGERQILQNSILITGAHDIIAPLDERKLDLTVLSSDDWNLEMVKRYDNIWVHLPHEDIQRNKCCSCTKYVYQPQISGRYGKTERYWYFSALPEISSEKCKECEWRNS